MLDHGYYHSSLFPTVSKPVLLGCKYTVKQRRDVSKHLHFSNQIAKLSSSSVPAQSNLNWDLHFNQEFPVRFGCCKRQSWSTRWVDQQYFDSTTWPCLTHALRPTHSLRFARAVEMWHFGSLASGSPIRQAGTRTGTTSSTSHPSSNPQRISWLGKFGLKQTAASPHILNATHNHQYFFRHKPESST